MPDFWSLPRHVREKIYRFRLVEDKPIDDVKHEKLTRTCRPRSDRHSMKRMPAICLVSDRAEREAAPIFYGENHFVFGRLKTGRHSSIFSFTAQTWTRHLRLVRRVTCQWPTPYAWWYAGSGNGMAGEVFTEIARFKNLQELNVRLEEEAMIWRMLVSRRSVQTIPQRPLTLQDGVALLRHPGMNALLKISGVTEVNFLKALDDSGTEVGGPISGGYLETVIRPRLQGAKTRAKASRYRRTIVFCTGKSLTDPSCSVKGAFDFLSLPAELRNRIYALLLKTDGPIHPSTKPPSSIPKGKSRKSSVDPGSGLTILGVNQQIYNEAYGIFYDSNTFEFYYPIQLQAFILSLGQQRLAMIRDVTVQYHNIKSGGVDLAEVSLPMLKQLTGLRKLQIVFVLGALKNRTRNRNWWHIARYSLKNATP